MGRCLRYVTALRLGAVVFTVAAILGGIPSRAAAEQIYGGSYENETYGYSFDWDESIWTVSTLDTPGAEGMNTDTVATWGMIYGIASETDSTTCFEEMLSGFSDGDGEVIELAPKRYARPEPAAGIQGELVSISYGEGADAAEMLFYIGCRPLDGGESVLNVLLGTVGETYELELGHWQELLGSIEVEDGTGMQPDLPVIGIGRADENRAELPDTGLDGETYTHAEFGYSIRWDELIWTARELEENERLGDGVYLEGESSFVLIQSFYDADADVAGCLDTWSTELKRDTRSFENVRVAPSRYERPRLSDLAAGELFRLNAKNKGGELAAYIECREIPTTGAIVVFNFYSGLVNYEAELPAWQDVLDSVESRPVVMPEGAAGASADLAV